MLDVGCGMGMFSMWAMQAGAKHVYAVECSAIYSKTKVGSEAGSYLRLTDFFITQL